MIRFFKNANKPKLLVHIGGAKCGSSSIQAFLRTNVSKLSEQGFIVPDVDMSIDGLNRGAQIEYFETSRDDISGSKVKFKNDLQALVEAHERKKDNKGNTAIIVSAENLSCWNDFADFFTDLDDVFDIKVIIYIRRQDEYLLSFWQQWYVKINDDFWAWILSTLNRIGDWSYAIMPWVKAVGRENVVVRRFSRKYFKENDLIVDFSNITGIDTDGLHTQFNSNVSYNDAVMSLASSVNDVFDGMHDNVFYQMMADWGGEATQKKLPSNIMNFQQRMAINNYYNDSNENIKNMFFDEEEELFEPLSEKEMNLDSSGTIEGKLDVLTRLVFESYKNKP